MQENLSNQQSIPRIDQGILTQQSDKILNKFVCRLNPFAQRTKVNAKSKPTLSFEPEDDPDADPAPNEIPDLEEAMEEVAIDVTPYTPAKSA